MYVLHPRTKRVFEKGSNDSHSDCFASHRSACSPGRRRSPQDLRLCGGRSEPTSRSNSPHPFRGGVPLHIQGSVPISKSSHQHRMWEALPKRPSLPSGVPIIPKTSLPTSRKTSLSEHQLRRKFYPLYSRKSCSAHRAVSHKGNWGGPPRHRLRVSATGCRVGFCLPVPHPARRVPSKHHSPILCESCAPRTLVRPRPPWH